MPKKPRINLPPPPRYTAAPVVEPRVEPKRMGFDPLRPVRYLAGFVGGTIGEGLDGISRGGRLGMWAGLGVGLLVCVATSFSFGAILMFGVAGAAAGGAVGGVLGTLTGGASTLGREARKDKYADELAARSEARSQRPAQGRAPASDFDYRDAYDRSRAIGNYNFDRAQQQGRENAQDSANGHPSTSWQDYVTGRQNASHERGF